MKIIVTGAAGLVGQNLIPRLKASRPTRSSASTSIPPIRASCASCIRTSRSIEADLAEPGPWERRLAGADALVLSQAQIGGLVEEEFTATTSLATRANPRRAQNGVSAATSSISAPRW